MNIVQFLEERLAEDERMARVAAARDSTATRPLREVAFKRALIDRVYRHSDWDFLAPDEHGRRGDKPLLTQLAAIYADHPDFRSRWLE